MAFEYGQVNRDKVSAQSDSFSKSIEFRPKSGTSQVRVLPPHKDSDTWFRKSVEHWVDGVGYVPCSRQFGQPCPICEEGERMYQNSDNEDAVKASLDLRPREQYYYNVVVFTSGDGKTSPKDGVRIMRTGVKVLKQLRSLDNDEASGWGDMTSPKNGFNVSIARSGQSRTDTEYTVSPVNSKGQTLEEMLARHDVKLDSLELFNLDEYVKSLVLPYDDLKAKFENKQIAPGFPGGPRVSPTMLEPVHVPQVTPVGEFTAPPVIEED